MVRLMGQLFQCIVGEALEPPAKNATHFWISEGNIILLPYGNVILLCKITGSVAERSGFYNYYACQWQAYQNVIKTLPYNRGNDKLEFAMM